VCVAFAERSNLRLQLTHEVAHRRIICLQLGDLLRE